MAGFDPARKTSDFMHPFVVGATAFLAALNVLFIATRGEYHSPDRWSDAYMIILAIYGGSAEIAHLAHRTESDEPDQAGERLRKGGPLITLWLVLLLGAGIWRIADATRPMPPELKEIALKVLGVFFGTYALRQYRRSKRGPEKIVAAVAADPSDPDDARLVAHLRAHGPQTPKALSDTLKIPRRTVSRMLKDLIDAGTIQRDGGLFDPSAVYRLADSSPHP